MKLHNLSGRVKRGYTTWGCVWSKGSCQKDTSYCVKNEDGTEVPMQSRITAFWPDGSVKWTAHTANAEQLTNQIEVFPLKKNTEFEKTGIRIEKKDGKVVIIGKEFRMEYVSGANSLFETLYWKNKKVLGKAVPVLVLEEQIMKGNALMTMEKNFEASIQNMTIEEEGPLFLVLKYEGIHISKAGEKKIPFIIRMNIGMDSGEITFTHTFFYDGDEEKDFLKGLGVRFEMPLKGAMYNRHLKVEGDAGCFHEAAAQLLIWKPRLPEIIYQKQMQGKKLELSGKELEMVETALEAMPFWDTYEICQDRVNHFGIQKKVKDENCCLLDCMDGVHTKGAVAVGSENGSVLFDIRDFWEKYPSGYQVKGLTQENADVTVWLWAPKGGAMDFRHYANRGYNQSCYEGYDFKGADPVGIACTSEFSVAFSNELIPSDEELLEFSQGVNMPAQYVGDVEYYYDLHAFGRWSRVSQKTEMECWIEKQLEHAVDFYIEEVKQRQWYGMFNYGDFMHTYDPQRHQWRYDIGGYAWDNTELVPTLWLWLYFMRTGREDVFELAEKLSRHTSEVDVYHFGRYKGMGSRHNVRHWGCPCKEARIAMAAHHRYFYYLTGDYRMGEIFEELKDNEETFLNKDPLEAFYPKEEMVYPSHARSGPDWSSLCANWMTRWERFEDEKYRKKIEIGIEDIKKAPLRLISGPDFEFDPKSTHLRYIGENAAGGTHLQICMGAPQVWIELAELLENKEFEEMLAEYGWFYYQEERIKQAYSKGIIGNRAFSLPFMAAAMAAYGASYYKDEQLAQKTWEVLLSTLINPDNVDGFECVKIRNAGNATVLKEIPWISTNFVAQWCLNAIMVLEFIRPQLPATLKETISLIENTSRDSFHRA